MEWSTSDDAVATVDQEGRVEGIGPGTAMVLALSEGVEGTATVTVGSQDVPDFSGEWAGEASGDQVGGSATWILQQTGTVVTGVVFAPSEGSFSGTIEAGILSATIFFPSTGGRNVGTVQKVNDNTLFGDFVLLFSDGRELPFSITLTRTGSSVTEVRSSDEMDSGTLMPDGSSTSGGATP